MLARGGIDAQRGVLRHVAADRLAREREGELEKLVLRHFEKGFVKSEADVDRPQEGRMLLVCRFERVKARHFLFKSTAAGLHRFKLLRRMPADRELGRGCFNDAAVFERRIHHFVRDVEVRELVDVLSKIKRNHIGAVPHARLENAERIEALQRNADREAVDPEAFREIPFGRELRAGGPGAVDHHLSHFFADEICGGSLFDFEITGHGFFFFLLLSARSRARACRSDLRILTERRGLTSAIPRPFLVRSM